MTLTASVSISPHDARVSIPCSQFAAAVTGYILKCAVAQSAISAVMIDSILLLLPASTLTSNKFFTGASGQTHLES
jgi:hypothetical protein